MTELFENPASGAEFIELADLQAMIAAKIGVLEQWVRAEVDSHSVSNGHHYFGLLQKASTGEEVARARGIIWKSASGIIREFEQVTGQKLQAGIKIVVRVVVQYNARFGLSLIINGIDASYSLGQREIEKKETLERLSREGLLDMQKSLSLPFLPTDIAVISSKDAAGYGDFLKHLEGNQYGFKYNFTLFQSFMQGDKCSSSIAASIAQINAKGNFSLILVLRGGGAESDLFCYDDYLMAKAIASSAIPVLTAVGHERDFHIADMVSHMYFKTPTAVADFLIDWVAEVESSVNECVDRIKKAIDERVVSAENEIARCLANIRFALNAIIGEMENRIALAEAAIKGSDPRSILSQGYVLAADKNGKILKSVHSKSSGDDFILRFRDGLWDCLIGGIKEN